MNDPVEQLLSLSHQLGREDRSLAILGEGNCSVRLSADRFLVKASGSSLRTLTRDQLTECDTKRVTSMIDMQALEGAALEKELLASRVNPDAPRPSIETAFHAWLLQQDGVHFVGHCHPVSSILCSRAAEVCQRTALSRPGRLLRSPEHLRALL